MSTEWRREKMARLTHTFWLPCPSCGNHFGGFEWRNINGHQSTIPDKSESNTGRGICPDCTARGVGCKAHAARLDLLAHPGHLSECEYVERAND